MPEYVRVATFEADNAAIDGLISAISAEAGPPEGVPAKSIMVVTDRAAGKVRTVVRFGSEEDLRKGNEALDAMTRPENINVRRVSVESFQIELERQAP
jgi:hypothetical protein